MQRQQLLEEIQRDLSSVQEELRGRDDIHRVVMEQISNGLVWHSINKSLTYPSAPARASKDRRLMYDRLLSANERIERFKRSDEEGWSLWAKVLEWSISQFTFAYHAALYSQERLEPQKIYGAENSMQEVPIPD